MTAFRFIHCSDLHIDSPFKGLASQVPSLTERLRESTFRSFHNIVKLAVEEQVDAVLIAGDIFDGADRSLQAQLKFRRGLLELSQKGIPSFIVHGNHDPSNSWSHTLDWPESTTIFPGNKVERVPVIREGKTLAWIYGISYPQKEVNENLALKFKKDQNEGFSVGLLHANVGQHSGHENYAPCSLQDLISRNFDYWALGHVHEFKVLRENNPCIVYSGNTQARHLKETGPKGCCLVTLNSGAPANIRFMPTDVVSYRSAKVDVSGASSINEVLRAIQLQVEELAKESLIREGLVARLVLTGRTLVHKELQNPGATIALAEEVHTFFEGHSPWVLVDLSTQTAGTYDINSLKEGKDFVADLLNLCEDDQDKQLQNKIQEAMKPVFESWAGRKYLENDEDIESISLKARNLALDQLVNRENS
ncbi:MAG: DNA repair exonuclease [Nitrospinae bacterium]|nr:DNA repair exonuclease [Nitrospinota bacterium]MBL7021515.1 DNA repair exonuclease [Nitrospinaceae bacterium]